MAKDTGTGRQHADADRYFSEALEAGKRKEYDKAISILKFIIANFENMPKALLYLGRSYHATGRHEQAIQAFEFHLKMNPGSVPGLFFLARTYLAMGIYDRAVHYFKATLDENPHFAPAYSLIGIALLKAKKPELAVSYFETALTYAPENKRIYNGYLNALLVKAIKFFQKEIYPESAQMFEFLLKNKGESLLPHLYLGRINRIQGNLRDALKHYDIASRMVPEDPLLKLQKAVTLLRLGDAERATTLIKDFTQLANMGNSVTRNPDAILKYITLTLFSKNQFRQAIYYGKEILKSDYGDVEIHSIIAESYFKLGDLNKSKNHYLRCIEGDKGRCEYYYGLFSVLWARKEYDEIIQKVQRLRRINPGDKIADYFEALCLAYTGDDPTAIIRGLSNQIRSLGPDPLLMQALGEAYLANDMSDLAESWILRTLKVQPHNKDAMNAIVGIYEILDKPKKQREYMEKYLKEYPSDNQMRKAYAKLLIRLKSFNGAIVELNHLIPVEKNNLPLKKVLAHCQVKAGKFGDAIPVLKELLREEPQSMEHVKSLIICLQNTESRETTIAFVEKARRVLKDKESLSLMLGVLYFKNGLYEKSLTLFRDVIAKEPKNWRAYQNLGIVYKKMGNNLFGDKFLKRAEEYRIAAESKGRV